MANVLDARRLEQRLTVPDPVERSYASSVQTLAQGGDVDVYLFPDERGRPADADAQPLGRTRYTFTRAAGGGGSTLAFPPGNADPVALAPGNVLHIVRNTPIRDPGQHPDSGDAAAFATLFNAAEELAAQGETHQTLVTNAGAVKPFVPTGGRRIVEDDLAPDLQARIDASPGAGPGGISLATARATAREQIDDVFTSGGQSDEADIEFTGDVDTDGAYRGTLKDGRVNSGHVQREPADASQARDSASWRRVLGAADEVGQVALERRVEAAEGAVEELHADRDIVRDAVPSTFANNTWATLSGNPGIPGSEVGRRLKFTVRGTAIDPAVGYITVAQLRASPVIDPDPDTGSAITDSGLSLTNAGGERQDDNLYYIGRTAGGAIIVGQNTGAVADRSIRWTIEDHRLDVTDHVALAAAGTTNVDLSITNGRLQAEATSSGGVDRKAVEAIVRQEEANRFADTVADFGNQTEAQFEAQTFRTPGLPDLVEWDVSEADPTGGTDNGLLLELARTDGGAITDAEVEDIRRHHLRWGDRYFAIAAARDYLTPPAGRTSLGLDFGASSAGLTYPAHIAIGEPVERENYVPEARPEQDAMGVAQPRGWLKEGAPDEVPTWQPLPEATGAGKGVVSLADVDGRIDETAQEGNANRWRKDKLPVDTVYTEDLPLHRGREFTVRQAGANDRARVSAFITGAALLKLADANGNFKLTSRTRGEIRGNLVFELTGPVPPTDSTFGIVPNPANDNDRRITIPFEVLASELWATTRFNGATVDGRRVGITLGTIRLFGGATGTKQADVVVRMAHEDVAGDGDDVGFSVEFVDVAGAQLLSWTLGLHSAYQNTDASGFDPADLTGTSALLAQATLPTTGLDSQDLPVGTAGRPLAWDITDRNTQNGGPIIELSNNGNVLNLRSQRFSRDDMQLVVEAWVGGEFQDRKRMGLGPGFTSHDSDAQGASLGNTILVIKRADNAQLDNAKTLKLQYALWEPSGQEYLALNTDGHNPDAETTLRVYLGGVYGSAVDTGRAPKVRSDSALAANTRAAVPAESNAGGASGWVDIGELTVAELEAGAATLTGQVVAEQVNSPAGAADRWELEVRLLQGANEVGYGNGYSRNLVDERCAVQITANITTAQGDVLKVQAQVTSQRQPRPAGHAAVAVDYIAARSFLTAKFN